MRYHNILITGGAGFIGTNAALHFQGLSENITILDNFSRKGSKDNILLLKEDFGDKLHIVLEDVRNYSSVLVKAVSEADFVLHLAGQVAVTTSVLHPREDFESNALGTFNMLEAVRESGNNPVFIYSSTNKVYGNLESIPVRETETRYEFEDAPFGIDETQGVDFHSPYGCSKGTGDQYVHDYSKIFGLNTVVFRQSCIYGPHQFGIEDQGWLAWFFISALKERPITIYGNGKQVRDVLYIDDLVRAYELAALHIKKTKGQIYNIGGGVENSISVWQEFSALVKELSGKEPQVEYKEQRSGDQKIFIADIRKALKDFEWKPLVGVKEGCQKLYQWICDNKELF